MGKSKREATIVAIVVVLLIGGSVIVYACGPLCVLGIGTFAGAVGWVAANPGSVMCGATYGPNSNTLAAEDGPHRQHGHFGADIRCTLERGRGYYAAIIAARGTLQMGGPNERRVGGTFHGIHAYAASGFFSSTGRIVAKLTANGGWTIIREM